MLPISKAEQCYKPAHNRFLKPAIENFFKTELPKTFGPDIRSFLADELIKIFKSNNRDIDSIKPGQVLWNAVHKDTKSGAHNMKLVPVVLTLINDDDITKLENGSKMPEHRQNVVARMLEEAFSQDALLSMRDIGLLLCTSSSYASYMRKVFEAKHNVTLPHPGNLQDVGNCITHKYQIIYKCVVEKKSPLKVAKETNHSMKAVDRYLRDFNCVKTLVLDGKDEHYIHFVTRISLRVIDQYVDIINQYVKELDIAL